MKNYIFILVVLVAFSCEKDPVIGGNSNYPSVSYGAQMYTSFSEDWDNWRFIYGDTTAYVTTAFSEDWDNWDFSAADVSGDIKTVFSEDWDYWRLTNSGYTITMKTSFSEDCDNCDIDDNSNYWHLHVSTYFYEDWDNWDVYENGNHILDINTSFSNDFDNWRVIGTFPEDYPMEYRVAAIFIPVIVNVLLIEGIIE